MNTTTHRPSHRLLAALALLAIAGLSGASQAPDPLEAEITRWATLLRADTSSAGLMAQVKKPSLARLEMAEDALRHGWRLLALQRLAEARPNPSAALYQRALPPSAGADVAGLEAEWKRTGNTLRRALSPPTSESFAGIQPAAHRAMAEAAAYQVRAYYDASLDYGKNTEPTAGLYYLGYARAQEEFVELSRSISTPTAAPAPRLRSLAADIDSLEGTVLAAYQPPASIDLHSEFIAISAAVKEARELNAGGLRYGALLRSLQARRRFALLPSQAPRDTNGLTADLALASRRLASDRVDHSIGRLFLEMAQAAPDTNRTEAVAIARSVLPRYFAALEPAPPASTPPLPQATVTLVRWPYT